MNQKAHITGGVLLATAAMIAEIPPLTASLIVFGGMFNDLDYADILFSRRYHRKLLHNIYVILLFLGLSTKYPPLGYWALGMCLHDIMDMFSGSPVYVLWPVSLRGEHIGVGGWGVPNKSVFSFPVGTLIAVAFCTGYLVVTGYLGEAITLMKKLWELLLP
jgi:membrane-bound metal-dependent hydrolase YbcI (DUF457 family)